MVTARKVLLLEFNEINWAVIDQLLKQHGASYLPNFVRLREQGAWSLQEAVERPPHLDPWITWVTKSSISCRSSASITICRLVTSLSSASPTGASRRIPR